MQQVAAAGLRRSSEQTVQRLLDELCLPGAIDRVREGERHLKDYVEGEARELSPELFSKLMGELHKKVHGMMRRCGAGWLCEGGGGRCVRGVVCEGVV